MMDAGFNRSPKQLKQEYKARNPKSGDTIPDWIFYGQLDAILGCKEKYTNSGIDSLEEEIHFEVE